MTSSGVPEDHKPCCVASRAGSPQDTGLSALRTPRVAGTASASKRATAEMVQLEGGEFLMGADDPFGFPADGEGPVRAMVLKPLWIEPVAGDWVRHP
jgi:formylglycine-generating enzyme